MLPPSTKSLDKFKWPFWAAKCNGICLCAFGWSTLAPALISYRQNSVRNGFNVSKNSNLLIQPLQLDHFGLQDVVQYWHANLWNSLWFFWLEAIWQQFQSNHFGQLYERKIIFLRCQHFMQSEYWPKCKAVFLWLLPWLTSAPRRISSSIMPARPFCEAICRTEFPKKITYCM